MPCFKGLAVSIHTPDGPLAEHHIQKHFRSSQINAYIPVPSPKMVSGSRKAEPSTFAVSITLLTPGLDVPYSRPKPTQENPYPRAQVVGATPGLGREQTPGVIGPYQPMTSSHNETIAAYIYFDGRRKEEVATLLRRGEETWVNSRWVSIPQSEGGGLAEREFLFREVGLERWLNGLDLEGKDAAATIEKRRAKMEKKRIKKEKPDDGSDDDGPLQWRKKSYKDKSVLRYGEDALERVSDDEDASSSEEESDDDPMPESAGQIKVALFRVLASGEIKKGEYEAQFDANEDDDEKNGEDGDADHTTSFAKPKSLDPKSISTQTVTGIDPSDRPYATFTFTYRGEKTLRKMGILKAKEAAAAEDFKSGATKRKSVQTDLTKLKPLRPGGALGFTGIRENGSPSMKDRDEDDMDSDEDSSSRGIKVEEGDDEVRNAILSPDDARKQGEIADGVERIRLKRQHSSEPSLYSGPSSATTSAFPQIPEETSSADDHSTLPSATYDPNNKNHSETDTSMIGSPMKKPRASTAGLDHELRRSTVENLSRGMGFGYAPSTTSNSPDAATATSNAFSTPTTGESSSNAFGGLLPAVDKDALVQSGSSLKKEVKDDEEL